jgi:poly(A) polymerase
MLKEGMKIEARHVRRKQLSQYIDGSFLKRERKVSETLNNSASSIMLAKKRLSAETSNLNNSNSKRIKLHESVS